MPNINIAEFKRPGIFIREIDASVRQVPAITDIVNLVPGFSKKGPVNRPVLISNPQQLFDIFGDIDRNLEKKGCYFHRTILNCLQTAPVWALNLLSTNDELDTVDFATISLSSDKTNQLHRTAPYSRLFNRSDFWYRDTESFLNVAKTNLNDSRNILHITNVGDRKVSVFFFKSEVSGYNTTLEDWYGGRSNVPLYLNPTALASDYLVSMLIVAGDWSDYQELAVDTRWSQYFNVNGLRKDQVQNFVNDSSVTVLNYYADLSLIPFFKAEPNNSNARDIFVETVVNRDTDRTGVFVTFDIDQLEDTDFNKGLIDLLGSNLVGSDLQSINYLSYKETIIEAVPFIEQPLNRSGNVFGNFSLDMETKIDGVVSINQTSIIGSTDLILETSLLNYYILNGQKIEPVSENQSNLVNVSNVSIGRIRKDTLYLDSDGVLGVIEGLEVSNQTTWNDVPLRPLQAGLLPIAIAQVGTQGTSGDLDVTNIEILDELEFSLISPGDIIVNYPSSNEVIFEFVATKNSDPDTNYRKTKLNLIFNQILSNMRVGNSIIKDDNDNNITVTNFDVVTSGNLDKSLRILVSPSININNGLNAEIYFRNDEQTFKPETGSITLGSKTVTSSTSGYGVLARESNLYNAYVNGLVNSGDFFYPNLFDYEFKNLTFVRNNGNDTVSLFFNSGVFPVNFLSSKLQNRKIRLVGTSGNDQIFTVLSVSNDITVTGDFNRRVDLIVNELVHLETIVNGSVTIHGADDSDVTYLKFFLVGNNLTMEYTNDRTLVGSTSLNVATPNSTLSAFNLNQIIIFSKRSNYKQTLEIEAVLATNRILVNSDRYSEVRVGDYLKAFVDESELEPTQIPNNLTRIISKRLSQNNPTLVELVTDRQIDVIFFGDDAQTLRYTSVENYVNTYSAIVLNGFKIRQDSMPDGSEERQNQILNVMARNTPIFKGLVNRNKLSWRYLVDSWGLGLTSNSKQQMVDLCGERLTCLGLLNMPSAKSFKNSNLTNFTNSDGSLNTEYIRLGGDPNSSPAFNYSFGQGKGQSNVAYLFPYATIEDNGRPLSVPMAMFALNTFMRKHLSRLESVKPWTIAAGLTNGLVTGFGNVEIDLNDEDIENLNLMNANPIVFKVNRGFCIETDNTAQLSPRSSLSFIHSREVLVELEEELYQMLLTYQWRFNTPEVRDEIKAKADNICDRYVRENGLFDYENVIDESNNTPDLIDAQIGVLATYVEIVKGLAVIVNEVTILKTGDISSTGFRPI
jgi:hypothetical protein